jgi:hypothetical protein
MTIDEAITILKGLAGMTKVTLLSNDKRALGLGVEALQREKEQRDTGEVTFKSLPGEEMM